MSDKCTKCGFDILVSAATGKGYCQNEKCVRYGIEKIAEEAVPELKPCPCYSCVRRAQPYEILVIEHTDEKGTHYRVKCNLCGNQSSPCHHRKQAIEKWNAKNANAAERAEKQEPKPCPFCGRYGPKVAMQGTSTEGTALESRIDGVPVKKNAYYVVCHACGARTNSYWFEGAAIRAWNRRDGA